MREKSKYAGKTVKIKNGVGKGFMVPDMSGMDFVVEDWAENLLGCPWWAANGNPTAMEYAVRTGVFGRNNNVPDDNEVLGGKVGMFSHLFHINELELEQVEMPAESHEITRITSIRITDIIKGGAAREDNSKEYYAEALVSQIKELIGPDDVVIDDVQDFVVEVPHGKAD